MGFFARDKGEDGEQAEALARIEAGGIPPRAEDRLRALGTEGGLFTSGLSVNEFALLDKLGPEPLAQLMGASVVRPGWQYLPPLEPGSVVWGGPGAAYAPSSHGMALLNRVTEASHSQIRNYKWHAGVVCELDVLTDAWNLARRRALDRLAEEALQVGADAVVGVRLQRSDHDLGKGLIQCIVTGTAIRDPGRTTSSGPLLTDVSVQDYWRLRSAGHEPVGLVAATAVTFASAARDIRLRRMRTPAQNRELDELSRAFNGAREMVRAGLRGQVADAHASGVVGVELSHSVRRGKFSLASSIGSQANRGWHRGRWGTPYYVRGRADADRRGWVITMHAAGTAIRSAQRPPDFPVKTQIRIGAR
ncbi:MAG: heavy metal-binding domain-containing protein [Solirubrobacteraceae bacterium]